MQPSPSKTTADTLIGLAIVLVLGTLILPLLAALTCACWGLAAHSYHWMTTAF